METLKLIQDLFQGLGSIGVLIVVFAFWKMGFFDPKSKNGKIIELQSQMDALEDNHLHAIAEKLDKIIEQNTEQLLILRDIKNNQNK